MNYFLLHPGYSNVVAIDKHTGHRLIELSPLQDFRTMDVCNLQFESTSFELVTCTEVLEHLPTKEQLFQALSELRRVTSKTLLISLPFEEKYPLISDHYHCFDMPEIKKLFPSGQYTVINYKECKHIIIIEKK